MGKNARIPARGRGKRYRAVRPNRRTGQARAGAQAGTRRTITDLLVGVLLRRAVLPSGTSAFVSG